MNDQPEDPESTAPGGSRGGREDRLASLELRVTRLEARFAALAPAQAPPRATPPPPPPQAAPAAVAGEPPRRTAVRAAVRKAVRGVTPPRPPQPPRRRDLEAAIGQIWVSRVGLGALLLALALFLKWSYDRELISYPVRTALGILAGLALITAGEVLHRRTRGYAEAFTGAGIAAFYFTFFAAYRLYGLFGQVPSFALMVATTAAAVIFAVRYDAAIIAAMGILGGFAVPYLLPGPDPSLTPLLVYFLILEAGLLASVPRLKRHRELLLIFAVLAAFAGPAPAAAGLEVDAPLWLGYFLLLGGGLAWMMRRPDALPAAVVRPLLALLAILPFLVPGLFGRAEAAPALLVGYLLVAYGGFLFLARSFPDRSRLLAPVATAAVLLALAFSSPGGGADAWWWVAACAVVAAAAVLVTGRADRAASYVALVLGGGVGLVHLELATDMSYAIEALFPAAMLLLFLAAFLRRPGAGWRDLPLLLGSAAMFGGSLWRLLDEHGLAALDGALMLALAAVHAAAAGLAARRRPASDFTRLALAGVGVAFLTLVFPAQFDRATVTIAWAAEAAVLTFIGMRLGRTSVQASGCVVGLLAVEHFLAVDAHLFRAAPVDWVAFANPRALAAASLVTAAFLVSALFARAARRPGIAPGSGTAMVAAWAGVLANALLLTGVTLEADLLFATLGAGAGTKQFALTAYYALHSMVLVAVGLLRRVRGARLLGLVLFGGTLAKVMLVDLTFLDTIYRVFSFLALGGLLVAASYLYQRFRARLEPPAGEAS